MTQRVHVAIGGNVGEVIKNLASAVRMLDRLPHTRVSAVSPLYCTAPVGGPEDQPDFYNGAVELETGLEPDRLMDLLSTAEKSLGRVRGVKDGPRTVDLDILLWGDQVVDLPHLHIPHPRMHQRGFVLAPLNDIAPDAVSPATGKTVRRMLDELDSLDGVEQMPVEFEPLSSK